jgi:glycosyltransferase involved in cell wall biosynthesis
MPEPPELPPVAGEPISLILFAHNAEQDVAPLVTAWRDSLLARNIPFEIVFVDDGSSDATSA